LEELFVDILHALVVCAEVLELFLIEGDEGLLGGFGVVLLLWSC
jgi:hypothetical protein